MSERSFREAFNAIFHEKSDFEDFLNLDVKSEVTQFKVADRKIFRVSEKLKGYLKFIDRVVLRNLSNIDSVHSFVRGRSVSTAVSCHLSSRYFFKTDICEFYDNITTFDIERVLRREVDNIPVVDFEKYVEHVACLTTLDGFLPIGFPTSPQLSNSFLYEFDDAVLSFCNKKNLVYTRYADDIIISSGCWRDLRGMDETVQDFLDVYKSSKMILNKSKTSTFSFKNKVKILGLVILPNGQITIDSKYKSKVETLMYLYGVDKTKYEDYLDKEFKGERSVFGLLNYINSVDPGYLEKLQRKYGAYVVRTFMEDRWNVEE